MCPYNDKHSGTSNTIRDEVLDSLEPWELEELNSNPDNIIVKRQEGSDNNKPL